MKSRIASRRGAATQQYAIVVGLIAVVALSATALVGSSVAQLFGRVSNRLANITGNGTVTGSSGGGIALPPPYTCANGTSAIAKVGTSYYLCRGARGFALPANAVTSCLPNATLASGGSVTGMSDGAQYGALRYEYTNITATGSLAANSHYRINCDDSACTSRTDTYLDATSSGASFATNTSFCSVSFDNQAMAGQQGGEYYMNSSYTAGWTFTLLMMGGVGNRASNINAYAYSYLRAANSNTLTMLANAATEKVWLENAP